MRVAILSDLHANAQALEAVMSDVVINSVNMFSVWEI